MIGTNRFYVDLMSVHQEVTGSCFLVIVNYPNGKKTKFIVDCGLFQEGEYSEYNETFPFNAENIEFALITHNHVDHIGRLPLLAKQGFSGKIYATEPTTIFMPLALSDSYRVLRDVYKRNNKKCIYTENDVSKVEDLIQPVKYKQTMQIDENIRVTFFKNGHLIGAAMILVQVKYKGCKSINLLFTGDYNNKNVFLNVHQIPKWVRDLPLTIIQESTYGNINSDVVEKTFEKNIIECIKSKHTALCLVFSLGRAQEILYFLKQMQKKELLSKDIPIYFDGKLAHAYTRIFLHKELGIRANAKDFMPENVTLVDKDIRESLLSDRETKIIVTTSGMGTYGPAQTYIPNYISRKDCLIQFTGYTAEGTLGRKLKDAEDKEIIEISSLVCKKNAKVEYTTEFSAHAKADELLEFLKSFNDLKLVLINHGEEDSKKAYAESVIENIEGPDVGIIGREYFYRISQYGLEKTLPTKFM